MSMVTSCPACTTTFRVTPEQLRKREGKVRCGKCSGVFDAFRSLASQPDEVSSDETLPRESPAADALPSSGRVISEPDSGGTPFIQAALDMGATPGQTDVAAPSSSTSRPNRRLVWAVAIAVLTLLLLLQLVYALRDRISAAWPAAKPVLENLCRPLNCTVSFPRRTEQLALESSDLQPDPARPNVVVLTATLRNRGSALVAHPSLQLTLTNLQDQALAQRVLHPADYLTDPSAVDRGLAGMAEVNVRMALDTGDLKPAGYRLFIFYP